MSANTYEQTTERDKEGRVIGVTFPDADVIGSTTTPWEYDNASRLTDIPGQLNDAAVEKRARAPDQDGR